MQCGGKRNLRPYEGRPWRVVEAQHRNGTRRLVDSDEEQGVLEALIDRVKPPAPAGPEFRGLHYLLFTPFRHPPLPHGSRFGTRAEPSLFYASEVRETALAETAYYRLLFLEGTRAELGPVTVELSAFQVEVRTRAAVVPRRSNRQPIVVWNSRMTSVSAATPTPRATSAARRRMRALIRRRDRRRGR